MFSCDAILEGRRLLSLVHMVTSPLMIFRLHEAASFYQRALLANALTSTLRLHQRLPHFQLSRAFLAQALLEDSCHYLLYSLIFVNSYPVTSILYLCHPSSVLKCIRNLILFITFAMIWKTSLKCLLFIEHTLCKIWEAYVDWSIFSLISSIISALHSLAT